MRFVRSSTCVWIVGVLVLARLVESQTVGWSGTIQSVDGRPQPLRFEVPNVSARTFLIFPPGATTGVTASDIEFTGVSVRFKANLGHAAKCKLDAIPARGYKGTCTLDTGEIQDLTLVPPVPGMLLPEHEIILARDAGPPNISADASVFVLGPTGLVQAVAGTNGFTCYVRRPTVNDFWSNCQNREAATLLQAEQLRAKLRIAGFDERRVADSVDAAFRAGRVAAPSTGGIGYMLSSFAWTMNVASGAQSFLGPHLHFYTPHSTTESMGVDSTDKAVLPMRVEYGGTPESSVIVPVRMRAPPAAVKPPSP